MKKIIFLFVLALGLFSFNKSEAMEITTSEKCIACCTATLSYNGVYHSSYTTCVGGCGPASVAVACASAKGKAKAFINQQ